MDHFLNNLFNYKEQCLARGSYRNHLYTFSYSKPPFEQAQYAYVIDESDDKWIGISFLLDAGLPEEFFEEKKMFDLSEDRQAMFVKMDNEKLIKMIADDAYRLSTEIADLFQIINDNTRNGTPRKNYNYGKNRVQIKAEKSVKEPTQMGLDLNK